MFSFVAELPDAEVVAPFALEPVRRGVRFSACRLGSWCAGRATEAWASTPVVFLLRVIAVIVIIFHMTLASRVEGVQKNGKNRA